MTLLVASALMFAALIATTWKPSPFARSTPAGGVSRPGPLVLGALTELRSHPWSRGVLAVSSARNLIVGALDVLLVIMALDAFGLGEGGPGFLSALVGGGALTSILVTRVAVRRSRLRWALTSSLAAAAAIAVALGLQLSAPART